MTKQTTSTPDVGQMRSALDAIRWYSIHFPELPAPYVTLNAHPDSTVLGLQVGEQAGFEMWREALEFDADKARLITNGESSWLGLCQKNPQFGVLINLSCHDLPVVAERPSVEEQVAA